MPQKYCCDKLEHYIDGYRQLVSSCTNNHQPSINQPINQSINEVLLKYISNMVTRIL
jgi:hypothetical protein